MSLQETVKATIAEQPKHWREIVKRLGRDYDRALPWRPARTVWLVGEGSSWHVAGLVAAILERRGRASGDLQWRRTPGAVRVETAARFLWCASRAADSDWLVVFSHRGKTEVAHRALEQAKARGMFTICVTSSAAEHPGEFVDLWVPAGPMETVEPHTTALTSAICAATLVLGKATLVADWEALASEIEGFTGSDHIVVPSPPSGTVVLGYGESLWLARELALKSMELGGPWMTAMESEGFFHGPAVYYPRLEIPLMWVPTPSDPRGKELDSAPLSYPLVRVGEAPEGSSEPLSLIRRLVAVQKTALSWGA